jgi:predicted ATP-grasp superfamily ATP-dependent carboligase
VNVKSRLVSRRQNVVEIHGESGTPRRRPAASVQTTEDNLIVIGTNPEGEVISWNDAAEHLLGYAPTEAIGRNIHSLFPLEKRPHHDLEPKPNQADVSQPPRPDIPEVYSNHRSARPPAYPSRSLSVLLATASAGGTIAAVRDLGRYGLDVGVLSSPALSVAAWSRLARRSYPAPPESDIDRFLERLLEIGAAHPGQILLPTSDETAWLYTLHAERLGQHFCLYQPSLETMRRIVDKKLFENAVASAGLAVLPSWEPRSFDEAVMLAPSLPYPVLIKPRTHVHRLMNDKGLVAHSKSELIEKYRRFVTREQVRAAENPLLPDAGLPILQQFVSVAEEGVCSVTGFIDRTGQLFVTRRSTKVLQRSQPVGVGVCFESLPDSPMLSTAVRRLCRELQYFGMFEVEFLRFDRGWAPIDFNARLFNQVGMDIRRGMPLPLFACLDAAGETQALQEAVEQAQAASYVPTVFCDGFTLRAILTARTLTGRISREERDHWRNWLKLHAEHAVDFAADPHDPMPGLIHVLSEIYLGLRAFPRFLRSMPRLAPVVSNAFHPTKAKS